MQHTLKVAIIGKVSSGKSSFVNSLIGGLCSNTSQNRMTTSILYYHLNKLQDDANFNETFNTIMEKVSENEKKISKEIPTKKIKVKSKSGKTITKTINECAKIDMTNGFSIPSRIFDDVVLIDFPGIDDYEDTNNTFLNAYKNNLHEVNLILYVTDTQKAFNDKSEMDLFKKIYEYTNQWNKKGNIIKLAIVVNKIDELDDTEIEEIFETIKNKITRKFKNINSDIEIPIFRYSSHKMFWHLTYQNDVSINICSEIMMREFKKILKNNGIKLNIENIHQKDFHYPFNFPKDLTEENKVLLTSAINIVSNDSYDIDNIINYITDYSKKSYEETMNIYTKYNKTLLETAHLFYSSEKKVNGYTNMYNKKTIGIIPSDLLLFNHNPIFLMNDIVMFTNYISSVIMIPVSKIKITLIEYIAVFCLEKYKGILTENESECLKNFIQVFCSFVEKNYKSFHFESRLHILYIMIKYGIYQERMSEFFCYTLSTVNDFCDIHFDYYKLNEDGNIELCTTYDYVDDEEEKYYNNWYINNMIIYTEKKYNATHAIFKLFTGQNGLESVIQLDNLGLINHDLIKKDYYIVHYNIKRMNDISTKKYLNMNNLFIAKNYVYNIVDILMYRDGLSYNEAEKIQKDIYTNNCHHEEKYNEDLNENDEVNDTEKVNENDDNEEVSENDDIEEVSENDEVDDTTEVSENDEKAQTMEQVSEYKKFVVKRIKELRANKPGKENKEYMKLIVDEWEKQKKRATNTDSDDEVSEKNRKAKEYKEFVSKRIKELRASKPGKNNKEYMELIEDEWQKKKEIVTSKQTDSDQYDAKSNKPKRQQTDYQKFISKRMKELRETRPGKANKEYMKLAADDWRKEKESKKNTTVDKKSSSESSSSDCEHDPKSVCMNALNISLPSLPSLMERHQKPYIYKTNPTNMKYLVSKKDSSDVIDDESE